jgi:uncharacterized membrane protein
MKQVIYKSIYRLAFLPGLMLVSVISHAQNKEVSTEEVKSWLEQNWIWVAGGVILLILIMLLSRGTKTTNRFSGTRKTTTVVRDNEGHTKSVTTIEEKL